VGFGSTFIETQFAPGQRWVSNPEPELGLGLVTECEGRAVMLVFPSCGEQRTYSVDGAPLTRVVYEIGDRIRHATGVSLEVMDTEEHAGQFFYQAVNDAGDVLVVPERDLDSFFQSRKARERLLSAQLDRNRLFELRTETLLHHHRHRASAAHGLLGARVQLLPHQLYIAAEVGSRYAPRVLLADEVGLGKTIEAGLIIHQLLSQGRARRVLVIVPQSLVHQWLVELLRRFNLLFTVMDEERYEAAQESHDNPFESTQWAITTLDLLADDAVVEQAREAGFDVMVVDEAHHLQWHDGDPSQEFEIVDGLAAGIPAVLLLTGTPEQLGVYGHFARLRILDPARYHDFDRFVEEERDFEPLGQAAAMLADVEQGLDATTLITVTGFLGDHWHERLASAGEDLEVARDEALSQLLDRHGTGRMLFRNVREAVGGFPSRELLTYALPESPLPTEPLSEDEEEALEALLQPEQGYGADWLQHDPRVRWLVEFLQENRGERILLITHAADTARALEEFLRTRHGVRSAVFHEGLSLLARDRAAAYFADNDEPAQIMVCSEIGSEGRNFQFASDLVMFDLPLNADLLEQRIGRLDRIGQIRTIRIHLPHVSDSATHALLRWYHEALNAFERSSPVAGRVTEQVAETLRSVLRNPLADDIERLIANGRERFSEAQALHSRGRSRLLDLNSCRKRRAEEVVGVVSEASREAELSSYMLRVFDSFGIEHEHNPDESLVLRPGEHMLTDQFPGLSEDGGKATFRRRQALAREDLMFLTWEHPMVTGAMDLLLGTELGAASMCTIKLPPLKPSSLMLECIFVLRTQAPPGLQLQRYLPGAAIRLLIDEQGRELGGRVTRSRLNGLARGVPGITADDVMKHARTRIEKLLDEAQAIAEARAKPQIEQAADAVEQQLGSEIERLASLAEVNPGVREDEIKALAERTGLLIDCLERAEVELDAARLVVVT
jgi:ATP-dependent helicase HepA